MHTKIIRRCALLGLLTVLLTAGASSRGMELKEALAQFESGATRPTRCAADAKIGTRREVSRFQILPAVWRRYADSRDYQDPDTAWTVAERILLERYATFRAATGREWDAVDFYIMWNAPGDYQRVNWDRSRMSYVVRERAQRFANLLHSDLTNGERIFVRASS